MSKVKRLLHTRYRVDDLEKTVAFYRNVLGLEEVRRQKSPRGSELVFLKAPASEELIELCSYPASGPVKVQPDLTHLAFEVESLERFGKTTDPVIAERIAGSCLILPSSGVDLATVAKMADTAVNAAPDHACVPAADLPAVLVRATEVSAGASATCSEPDAGQLREGLSIVCLLRAPAGGDGVVLARGPDWTLRLTATTGS